MLLFAALLFGAFPAGVGQAGTVLAASDLSGTAASGRIGTSGGGARGAGVTVRLPRGALASAAVLRITTVTGVPAFAGARPAKSFAVSGTVAASGAALGRLRAPASLVVSLSGVAGDPARLRLAVLAADRGWSVLPTGHPDGALSAWIDTVGTYGVVTAPATDLSADHNILAGIDGTLKARYAAMDAPLVVGEGTRQIRVRFRVANTGATTVTLTPRLEYRAGSGAYLVVPVRPTRGAPFWADREWVPAAGGGSRPSGTGATIAAGSLLIPDPGGAPPAAGTPGSPGTASPGGSGSTGTPPAPAPSTTDTPGTATPTPAGPGASASPGPEVSATAGPAPEVSVSVVPQALAAVDALTAPGGRHLKAATGHRSMGANPDQRITVAPGSFTEQEFTVRVSAFARVGSGYELRLTDRGTPVAGAVARVDIVATAQPKLSPGQRRGTPVDTSRKATRPGPGARTATTASLQLRDSRDGAVAATGVLAGRATVTLARLVSTAPATTAGTAGLATTPGTGTAAALVVPAAPLSTAVAGALAVEPAPADTMNGVHGPYSVTSDKCGVCHRTHDTASPNLLIKGAPQSTLCFTCHNGTGAPSDVQAQFADASIPPNDPATRTWYGHDAVAVTAHTQSSEDEFGGVLNRHSECGDCHNAHRASPDDSTPTPTGWGASGTLTGMSGVAVVNGPAGSAPAYTFLNGEDAPVTREFQLCLKCHSGATTLPSNEGFTPSRYLLDKGIEFNPNNPSFHPVEAAGTNRTAAMAASLAGTSPYKLWNFTADSTVRCVNCHASSAAYNSTAPVPVAGDLPAHRSANRGILLQNYRDRVLKSGTEPYDPADFALCLVCHAEEPFVQGDSTATNFHLHAKHLTNIGNEGAGGTDIDVAGAGQGNALCAECHFRIHSTQFPGGAQTITGSRLVSFAPDVQPYNGVLSWTGGSCTLVCHGEVHSDYHY